MQRTNQSFINPGAKETAVDGGTQTFDQALGREQDFIFIAAAKSFGVFVQRTQPEHVRGFGIFCLYHTNIHRSPPTFVLDTFRFAPSPTRRIYTPFKPRLITAVWPPFWLLRQVMMDRIIMNIVQPSGKILAVLHFMRLVVR